ncbi:hypothetical protein [Halobacillus trueperi]|uniref:hypothetical protein n=1 Tax=Halobacillus trueperi TaxID=156205 RepID=UPI003734E681
MFPNEGGPFLFLGLSIACALVVAMIPTTLLEEEDGEEEKEDTQLLKKTMHHAKSFVLAIYLLAILVCLLEITGFLQYIVGGEVRKLLGFL